MLTPAERGIVSALYKGVFGVNPQWKSCSPCNKQIMTNLKKVYEKSCKVWKRMYGDLAQIKRNITAGTKKANPLLIRVVKTM